MSQLGRNILILMSLLAVGLLGTPAWSGQSAITKPSPCSKDLENPTKINGPTAVFEWSKDEEATGYMLLAGSTIGNDDYCDSGETTNTSYKCTDIPKKSDPQHVFAQLKVKKNGKYEEADLCVYVTEKTEKS